MMTDIYVNLPVTQLDRSVDFVTGLGFSFDPRFTNATAACLIVGEDIKETAMKYLCLICAEKVMEQMTDSDAQEHYEEYRRFTDDIRRSGHYLGCNRLLPAAAATTIRVRGGKISTTDGPYAETKEQMGGYYLIEARDLDEAIAVAARIPGAQRGCVEIRPVAEDSRTLDALGLLEDASRPVATIR
jgi:hypothetical protein